MKISNFINNSLDKIFLRLGQSNDSEIVTASLAAFKLVFIPFAASRDKKSTKEQKKYTIKRDILTESSALIGYIGVTRALKNTLSAPVCKKYYKNKANELCKNKKLDINSDDYKNLVNIDKSAIKNHALEEFSKKSAKNYTDEQKVQIKNLENTIKKLSCNIQNPKELYLNTKKTISHICVCTLALSVIPFTVNKILEVQSNSKNKNKQKQTVKIPSMEEFYSSFQSKGAYNVFHN